ncbi:hypothetical protein [Thomasclavelia cocleata]|uniref:hypothetical protein n=1 Tax=Thomasclavelia cocleata TaxID=69824 RepID=UPI002432A003|nr:hypothetical protein [Thomasclavelia cocleata]
MNYKTDNMKKCEYIDVMRKAYVKDPKQGEKCEGYKNKYTCGISLVCKECKNFKGD